MLDQGIIDWTETKTFAKEPKLGSFEKVFVSVQSIIPWLDQGIIDWIGTETRQIFYRMVVIAKVFKELFTLT